MSSIKLSPNASGTGEFTIAAPNSNTNRTLTLPDQTGTVLTNAGPFTANASASAGAVTIDASNNVGIGRSPASGIRLDVENSADVYAYFRKTSGANIVLYGGTSESWVYTQTNHPLILGTNNTERARITSDGYFKASNTGSYRNSGVACPEFNQSANSDGLLVNVTNASYSNNALAVTATRNTTNNSFFAFSYYNDTAAAYRFRVADSGNATNTNGSYGAISDAKLKENVVDATPKLEKLTQVRIVNYNLIGEQQKQIGVIAQELEQIFPGMVEELPDRDADGNDLGTTTKSVKYSVFVPMLIKAVQELNAKVAALEARLASDGPSNGGQA